MKKKIALLLIACTVLSSGGGAYAYTTAPITYVSMDIKPSVELGVNIFNKVVSVEAYNEDGKKIIENTDFTKYDIDNAIRKLVLSSVSDGYINKDGSSFVQITTATDKEDVAVQLDKSLKEAADEALNNNHAKAKVETEDVALTSRDEARKFGITSGKFNLIQKLQELDSNITVEDYKESSVADIQKKIIELKKLY
jgi:hypothetical protein